MSQLKIDLDVRVSPSGEGETQLRIELPKFSDKELEEMPKLKKIELSLLVNIADAAAEIVGMQLANDDQEFNVVSILARVFKCCEVHHLNAPDLMAKALMAVLSGAMQGAIITARDVMPADGFSDPNTPETPEVKQFTDFVEKHFRKFEEDDDNG